MVDVGAGETGAAQGVLAGLDGEARSRASDVASRMPVRSVIQASLVSRLAAMSLFVTILSGSAMPQPVMRMPVTWTRTRSRRGRHGRRQNRRRLR